MFTALIGFLCVFALIFARIPVGLALAGVGFVGIISLLGSAPAATMLAITVSGNTLNYTLAVIPLFVLMGGLIAGAGVSEDLYRAAQAFVGRRRGGLAMATILASGGFAAVSGSSLATAVTIGKMAIPSMRGRGYADHLATATVAAGATLGILIPPSIVMVIYGIATETNIGKLFAAGVVPGILGIVFYMFAVRWVVARNPAAAPAETSSTWQEKIGSLRHIWPVAVLFTIVLGGIYGGLFTATEAGGIGAAGAFVTALLRGTSLKEFYAIFTETAHTTGTLFLILIGAGVFGEFVNLTGAPNDILAFVKNEGFSPATTLIIILLIYLVLGCVLESLSMMLLTLPMFFPIVVGLGYDPVWFGIIVVMAVELALITPPMGMNLFVVRTITPEVSMAEIIRGILPFVVFDILRVALIVIFPAIAIWLPGILFN